MIRTYLSGPISTIVDGVTPEELKRRFHSLQGYLKKNYGNWEVVNPLMVEPGCGNTCNGSQPAIRGLEKQAPTGYEHSWFCWMKYDIREMLLCQAIVLMPGWEDSKGASFEKYVAMNVGMSPYWALLDDDGKWSIA